MCCIDVLIPCCCYCHIFCTAGAEKLSDQYGVAMGYLFPGDWFGYDEVIAAFTKVQGNRGRRMSLTLEPDERHYTTIARYATLLLS